MKTVLKALSGLVVFTIAAAALFFAPYALRVERHRANPAAGYYADFLLYVPADVPSALTLLVQPNNSGTNSDDPAVHIRDAWMMGFERKRNADEIAVVLLVPAFIRPGENWHIYTHALDRDVFTTEREDLRPRIL